jgi:type IX secretion system PorP/SprF family membrane protein
MFKKIYTIILASITVISFAQDLHLSQFDAVELMLNPAQTGMFNNAKFRAATQYRNQWGALATKYSTSVIGFDMPLSTSGLAQSRWGVGGYMVNDDASKVFNVFKFVVGGAYQITTPNDKYLLSVGLQTGVIYKNIKDAKLVFDNQWNDENFDPDKSSGENLSKDYSVMPEVNLGVFYKMKNKNAKLNPYAGLAFFHITNPTESFYGYKQSKLPLRYQFNTGLIYKINDKIYTEPAVFFQYQRNVYEVTTGLKFAYKFNADLHLKTGGFYRLNDAVIILLGLNYKNIDFNMSYDINTSELKQFTNGKGAFEFSLIFTGTLERVVNSLL